MTDLNSLRRAWRLGLIAGAVVLTFAAQSFAGGAENPDVLDIDLALAAGSGSALEANLVRFRTGQSAADYYAGNSAYFGDGFNSNTPGSYLKGVAFNYDSESGVGVDLIWFAFEPDSVKRTGTGASIRQKSNLALGVYVSSASGGAATGIVEGCSAKGKIKLNNDSTKASVSVKCPKSVWDDLGFNPDQIEAIQNVLGSTKIKFGYKGATPD